MSVHVIYYKDGAKMMRPVLTREEYLGLRDGGEQRQTLKAVRGGDESQKSRLVQMNYSCLPNEDGSLKGSTRMSTTIGMDVDHIPAEEMVAVKERILSRKDELGLLMLEQSARGAGYHLVFRRRPERSQEENLKWASEMLGVKYDKGAKDITRVFFTTTADAGELLYLDDGIFEIRGYEGKNIRGYEGAGARGRENTSSVEISAESNLVPSASKEAVPRTPAPPTNTTTRTPVPPVAPTEQRLAAFDLCAEQAGLKAGEMDVWGEHNWHANLMAVLSVGVGKLMSRDQLMGVIAVRLPNYSQTEDCRKLVDYFYEKYDADKGFMNASLREINARAQQEISQKGQSPLCESMPPAMPKRLPKLIELLTSKTPEPYKAAVAHAVFSPLGTHLCDVRFRYTDLVEHEATLMNCLMAPTGSGKGCIDEPISHIMADIRRRDKENERREEEWKKDCQKKGANKDKMVRPEGLVIQIIDPDMTKPALVTRMDEAEGHFVYVKLNELDLFEQLKGQTGKQHFQLMCLAFDPNSEYGQTRYGTQSVTARPRCRFNWNACTTIQKGRKFFHRVLTDGPISRINFCTIPEQEIGAEQPVYGIYDAAFDEQLKPYIDHLTSARGLVECQQAFKLAKKLQKECADVARLSQDDTYWNLSHRACVIAWLKACVLYVANGMKWEKPIDDFIRWSLQYDLWCKMAFFGAAIEAANSGQERVGSRGPMNLLELLPDTFSLDDAKRVRRQQGKNNEGNRCIRMIRTWMNRGYVIQNTEYSFQKSDKILRKNL